MTNKQEISAFKAVSKIEGHNKAGGIFVVEFEKKDKTLRQMTCTYSKKAQNTKVAKDASSYITVYDVIAGGYRTVNYATLKHVVLGKDVYKVV